MQVYVSDLNMMSYSNGNSWFSSLSLDDSTHSQNTVYSSSRTEERLTEIWTNPTVVGQLKLPDGTVTAPSLSFDTGNSGLYFEPASGGSIGFVLAGVRYLDIDTVLGTPYVQARENLAIYKDIIPIVTNVSNLGGATSRFLNVFGGTVNVEAGTLSAPSIAVGQTNTGLFLELGRLGLAANGVRYIEVGELFGSPRVMFHESVLFYKHILPLTSGTVDLGSSTGRFAKCFFDDVNTNEMHTAQLHCATVNTSLLPSAASHDIGTTASKWRKIYAVDAEVSNLVLNGTTIDNNASCFFSVGSSTNVNDGIVTQTVANTGQNVTGFDSSTVLSNCTVTSEYVQVNISGTYKLNWYCAVSTTTSNGCNWSISINNVLQDCHCGFSNHNSIFSVSCQCYKVLFAGDRVRVWNGHDGAATETMSYNSYKLTGERLLVQN
jgi:hypothetical protein